MPLAVAYVQDLDPLNNRLLSTLVAALPVLVLFFLLVVRRWLAPKAGAAGAATAILIAWLVYSMPIDMTCLAFLHGIGFGLLPIGWTVFAAMLLYNVTVETGQFAIIRRSVASLSGDARVQAILIGFAFGAILEGAAGAGTPVAICGAMLVGLGFPPLKAAILCLIANTSPVCYGGLGVPVLTLAGVTDISADRISIMCGHQLPLLSCLIPLYMVKMMGTWRQTLQVWPALVVAGGSFALFQFTFATVHAYIPSLILWPMTDIGGGIFSLVVTAIFLKFWQPKDEWHYSEMRNAEHGTRNEESPSKDDVTACKPMLDPAASDAPAGVTEPKLTAWSVTRAWMPFVVMSAFLVASGFLRQAENQRAVRKQPMTEVCPGLLTRYDIPISGLHAEVSRARRLQRPARAEEVAAALAGGSLLLGDRKEPERAVFEFAWVTAPGTPVFVAALVSMLFLRMTPRQIVAVFRRTFWQMRIPIPTIAMMLGLSYVTRYAGIDATLGVAFAGTGVLYPFFAAILGWLGVFLTGTDAGSNALFGSLQKITATEVYHGGAFSNLSLDQAQVLICTANSTGGVMGKMIDAQSICVATAGTHQIGREADIFKAVVWHSILLASIVGLLTIVQAYVYPFTLMVPQ
jgi:lactate permease